MLEQDRVVNTAASREDEVIATLTDTLERSRKL